jgi:hypothetical protein
MWSLDDIFLNFCNVIINVLLFFMYLCDILSNNRKISARSAGKSKLCTFLSLLFDCVI